MKIKICGMKFSDNIQEVAALQPDFLGFIFYKKSLRYFDEAFLTYPNLFKKWAFL